MTLFVRVCDRKGCVRLENVFWRVKMASRDSLEQVTLDRHVSVPRE